MSLETGHLSAILIIVSIAIGTLMQQALRTTTSARAVPNAVASMPIAHTYNGATDPKLSIFMKTAVVNGISGLQSLNTVSASCDTGNCSFPAYNGVTHSTVGIESMCFDISPFFNQENSSTTDSYSTYWWSNYSLPILDAAISDPPPDNLEMRQYLAYNFFLTQDEPLPGEGVPSTRFMLGWNPFFSIIPHILHSNALTDIYHMELSPQERDILEWSIGSVLLVIPTLSPCQNRSAYEDYLIEASGYPWEPPELPMVSTSSCPRLGMQDVQTFPGYMSLVAAACYFYLSIRHYTGSVVNGRVNETLVGDPVPLTPCKNYGADSMKRRQTMGSPTEMDI